ncbi:MAG TPA: ribosome maturation factor RimM [Flavipsychrobacter sp.]|nr:ribosome maturation factor RimM [Flavipsychrobacter sp.]
MIRIGKIVATHGLQGALILTHIVGDSKWLKKEDALFMELQKSSYIPFFVTQAKANNKEEYIINVEDIETVEKAHRLIGKNVYVQEDILAKYADETPLLWIGFNLVDRNKGNLGTIEDVMQAATQWLAKFTYSGKEVLIPLVEQTIESVNLKLKTVYVDLPHGLLEVYIGQ